MQNDGCPLHKKTFFSAGSGNSNFQLFSSSIHSTNQNYCQPVKNALPCQKPGLELMPSQGGL